MQDKHIKTKETDITSFLVVTFAILLMVLIAQVLGNLSKQTTSTFSQASDVKKLKTMAPKTLTGRIAYQDVSCKAGEANWFGVCISVSSPECASSCAPNVTVADKTSYGKEICPDNTRCVPITIRSHFDLSGTMIASPFCERVTGVTGSVCYSPLTKSTVKNPSSYERFYTNENGANASYFRRRFSLFGFSFGEYEVECPIYVTFLNGGIDLFTKLGGAKTGAVDHIETGYCYVPKPPTPTPKQ